MFPVHQNCHFDAFRKGFKKRFGGKKNGSACIGYIIDEDDSLIAQIFNGHFDVDFTSHRIGRIEPDAGQGNHRAAFLRPIGLQAQQLGEQHLGKFQSVVVDSGEDNLLFSEVALQYFDGQAFRFLIYCPLIQNFHANFINLVKIRQKGLSMLQSILFILVAGGALYFAFRQFAKVRRNILLGKPADISGDTGQRWRNVLLIAFGQQKMFKRPIPAVFHFFIYAAFLLTQIELFEIFIDGIFGVHRFFAPKLGGLYTLIIGLIEILSLLAFVATAIFLIRRNILRIPRFQKPEMKGWPAKDANLILLGEIILLVGIFSMNGADTMLQGINPEHYHATGAMPVSSWLGPALFGGLSEGALVAVERFGWWLHILAVLGFLNYLPQSKHLHILLAFPNTYFARLQPKGELENMPEVMNEVKGMLGLAEAPPAPESGELPEFGANDVTGLTWKNVLDAYTCTECGRCTAMCPANLTGKKLSPRKIMMDVRDRAEEIGQKLDSGNPEFAKNKSQPLSKDNFQDGKSLFDYITAEELHACTTCNACVEACPVLINPLDIIVQMRRYEVLTMGAGAKDWLPMFNSLENSGAPWAMSVDRDQWRVNG